MKLLELKDFEKAYPFLVRRIDEIRGKSIINELTANTKVPIEMQDAAFVDSYLEINNPQTNRIGYEKAQKILQVVELYPNIDNWLEVLYPTKKKLKIDKVKYKILKEIVVWPQKNGDGTFYCVDNKGKKQQADKALLGRIEVAYKKKKIIRLRLLENGKYKYRIMKSETFGESI